MVSIIVELGVISKGEGVQPAALSLYSTPLFSAAMGCSTMLLMIPVSQTVSQV